MRFEQLEKRSNEQAELHAELLRANLPVVLERGGLPEKVEGELLGKVLNGAHMTSKPYTTLKFSSMCGHISSLRVSKL